MGLSKKLFFFYLFKKKKFLLEVLLDFERET